MTKNDNNNNNNENPDDDDAFHASGGGGGPPSLLNIILLYVTLMGLGAVGGYGLFYHLFQQRCHVLVQETQNHQTLMKREYEQKLETAMEGQRLCMANSQSKQDLSVLQGRLEAQSNLVDRHSELLEKYDHATAESLELRKQVRESRANHVDMQRRLDHITKESLNLQLERNDLKKRVAQQEVRLRHMQGQVEDCMTRTVPQLQEQTNALKEYLYSQHYTQALKKFGNGPYHVEFTLDFPTTMAAEPNTFVVECFPLQDMPHTIYTFLDLVSYNLYDETVFSTVVPSTTTTTASGANPTTTTTTTIMSIEGGNPTTAIQAGRLHQRYVQAGYRNRSPLGFNEYDETKHAISKMTIGFTANGGRGTTLIGPGLVVYTNEGTTTSTTTTTTAAADKSLSPPIFGKIISGMETLQRIVNAPKAVDGKRLAMNVEIESVRILGYGKDDDNHEGAEGHQQREEQDL